MSLYRFELKVFSRSRGESAVMKAAYRTGSNLVDARTGERFNYSHRGRGGDIVASGIFVAGRQPRAADCIDTEDLWNSAEAAERRKDSCVAREIIVALPHEISDRERELLTRSFTLELSKRYGVAAEFAIHRPGKAGDDRNHHAHVMFTTRRVALAAGELQFGAKTLELDDRKTGAGEVTGLRTVWETMHNRALSLAGSKERVSAKSLAAQGIARKPGRHLGPVQAAMARKRAAQAAREPLQARRLGEGPEIGLPASTGLPEAPALPAKPIGTIKAGEPNAIFDHIRRDEAADAVSWLRLEYDEREDGAAAWRKRYGRSALEVSRLAAWWRTLTLENRNKLVAWVRKRAQAWGREGPAPAAAPGARQAPPKGPRGL